MPLFQGEDLVDITTPDGRTLKLPRSIVPSAMLPTPSVTAPSMPTDGIIPAQASMTGGELPVQQPQPIAAPQVQNAPDYPAMTIDNRKDPVLKQVEAEQKAAMKAVGKPAPAPKMPTPGPLATPTAEQQGGFVDEREAILSQADIDGAGQFTIANAYKTRNDELDKLFARRQEQAEADLREQDLKRTQIESMRDKIASTKIDRSANHPILAAIGMALADIGAGMQGKELRGLEMLYQSIDRKVAGQMADLDQKKTILGFTKDELGLLKDRAQTRLGLNNILIAGESEKAARQVEEITARTTGEKSKAIGAQMVAQLRQRAAEASMTTVKYELDYNQKERAEKNQNSRFYSQLGQAERHHQDDIQVDREKMALDYQTALAAARAKEGEAGMKAMAELTKENESRGVTNLVTKEPLLTQSGIDMMNQAAKHEAEAKSLRELDAQSPDPKARDMAATRANALEQKAAVLRGNARTQGRFRARNDVEARELGKKYASSQSAMKIVDRIKLIYDSPDGGKSYLSTGGGRAAIQAEMGQLNVALKDAWQAGAWDKGLATLMSSVTGGDPTKGADVDNLFNVITAGALGTDPQAFKKRLDSVASGLEDDTYNQLTQAGWDVKDRQQLFGRQTAKTDSADDKSSRKIMQSYTPGEQEADIRTSSEGVTGAIRSGVQQTFYPMSGSAEERANAAANSGSQQYPGLSDEQGKGFGEMVGRYNADKTGKSGADAGNALVGTIVNNAESRHGLSISMLHLLKDSAPELYERAVAGLPKGSKAAEQISHENNNRVGVAETPVAQVILAAKLDDPEAKKELARRASDKDHPDRQAAAAGVQEVINARGRKRDPLGISRGGK